MCTSQKNLNVLFDEEKLILDFDEYSRDYRSLTESTIKNRHVYLQRFFKWFNKQKYLLLNEVDSKNLNKFLMNYHSKYSLESIRKLHLTLRSFFDYCLLYDIIKCNFKPLFPLKKNYTQTYIPAVLNENELQLLITKIKNDSLCTGVRNYAMLLILIYYGVRGFQVRNLKLIDIDWQENTIYFKGCKNGNSIKHMLCPEVGNAIMCYIKNERQNSFKNNEVFLSKRPPSQ